ncbi:MAG: 4'-phosphopantetheinyl transferase superfamily protein [Pseudomonadota bacterium]|nr:4'-phosphopantetheinyl transferase superfamily protein [Pseudomonadota bacterium]
MLADERALLERAAPQRVRQLAAGRVCARRAAAQFGIKESAITMRADRRPRWPMFLTGSITHTGGFAAAAVGERQNYRAIGIDAERIGSISRDIWTHVLLPIEMERLRRVEVSRRATIAALIFSAKEAFYKCQYEVTGQWLEFTDVTVDVCDEAADRGSFAVHPVGRVELFKSENRPARGRFAVVDSLVLTAIVATAR